MSGTLLGYISLNQPSPVGSLAWGDDYVSGVREAGSGQVANTNLKNMYSIT